VGRERERERERIWQVRKTALTEGPAKQKRKKKIVASKAPMEEISAVAK
jgi:hypothetical protein